MTKHLMHIAAPAGLFVALWLVWHENPRAVLAVLRGGGAGLLLAALVHVLDMLSNACAWRTLFVDAYKLRRVVMLQLVWIRESVNSMLPVARVGGDIVAFRLQLRRGVKPRVAAASLIVDTQLTLIGQMVFAMIGIAYLFSRTESGTLRLAGELAWGVVALAPAIVLFALVQQANPFRRVTSVLNRMTSGKFARLLSPSAHIDESIKRIWRHRAVVLHYVFLWQPLHCAAVSLEIWLALYFLGSRVSFVEAVVIESLIQALSSAAFFVPGALGVQESGFLVIGGALSLDPATCLALAGARRIRDLFIFMPGLLAWQATESRWRLSHITTRCSHVRRARRRGPE
ncbi:lysylphosphatidylglycerol synthase domain-containing protein [Paraburkholderia mimosarum]|uniref:lysylphosphatidylglycerol synthase domain-containing protein n=1 Tax=Paraburkholderia mimosarum TaxID=312026 RepID=UPI0007C48CBB|nr:lysylphosphatidylglycerol synthase domain-containing protein [Paraburkholderia mimosarum]